MTGLGDFRQLPGISARAVHQGERFGIVGELFGHRVPFEFAAELDGDVGEVADRADAVADIDREIRVLAGPDAVEEVIVFAGGIGVEVDFLRADDGVEDFLGAGLQRAAPAGVADPAVAADELDARGCPACRS